MMFMKRGLIKLLIALFVITGFTVSAQKKTLVLDEIMKNRSLYATSLNNLQWNAQSGSYTFVANNKLVLGKVKQAKRDTILSLEKLNEAMKKADLDPLKRFPFVEFKAENQFGFIQGTKSLLYDMKKDDVTVLNLWPDNAENNDATGNGEKIAYTIANNLYVAYRGTQLTVSDEKNTGIVFGKTVHRNEFGIDKGTFWSPKGNLLAFYRMDESMVTEFPLVDINERVAKVNNIRYPMAGMKSHEVTVGIYNPITQQTIYLKTGEPKEQYLTNITWSPDEKSVYIAVLNREQNHLKINQYNALTGDLVKTLFEEKNDRYVEPENGLFFNPAKTSEFLWLSERDGFNHFYLYNTDGKMLKQLTSGKWMITNVLGFDPKGKKIYFYATKDGWMQSNVYAVELSSGKITRITSVRGTHNVTPDKTYTYFIDKYSNTDIANELLIQDNSGKTVESIFADKNPVKDYTLAQTDLFTLKADDGTDLQCRLIKPANFDPNKKYPVIVYVYGGPHAQLITDSWLAGGNLFFHYLAQEGYLVFTMDSRGSANRGFEFESCIHRNLGVKEVADQMVGVNYLKSQAYVDATRIGVDGWSYGGFLTVSMKLKNPGVFKVATAGGPVIDWKWYEVMYGERYMDTPEENPEGYKNASLLNYVDKLDGKLLIIQGAQDNTVVWQHSLNFIQKCIEKGKQVDYFVYPNHEHNVRGLDRAHLYRKIYEYYKQNL